ncbi:MAG: 2-oxoacid:ferredoxin oxidoreductase subunit beta [Deltaproteobacteria bacterium]|nr:2-oxoacid:ferredoxin oxidoreductase subunit beta [Deltaproteobacteria bacterium]
MAGETTSLPQLTRQDFVSNQDVRWCPGCGDYAILAQVQKILPELGIPRENFVFVSGIGCSSRLPYYVNTYGFHTIHGRAPAIATGIKAHRPDLQVWVVTGDGDALSIGGNHLIHSLRRNVDLKILLFNNKIYGLTKGQYSPTSEFGKKTKSTPYGSVDYPVNPISLALGAEATFVARTIDSDNQNLGSVLRKAARHEGSAFVEIFQNCVIFNDDAFKEVTDRQLRSDNMISLEHGKPLIFGKNRDKGIRMKNFKPEVVTLGQPNGVTEKDLVIHDENSEDSSYAFFLSRISAPEFPIPVGVFRSVQKETYEDLVSHQVEAAREKSGPGSLEALLHSGDTWVIEGGSPKGGKQ